MVYTHIHLLRFIHTYLHIDTHTYKHRSTTHIHTHTCILTHIHIDTPHPHNFTPADTHQPVHPWTDLPIHSPNLAPATHSLMYPSTYQSTQSPHSPNLDQHPTHTPTHPPYLAYTHLPIY